MSNNSISVYKGRNVNFGVSTFLLLLCLVNIGCKSEVSPKELAIPDTLKLHSGDLVFRKGESRESRAVTTIDRTSDYTHLGMVVFHNNEWYVLHAVPSERISEQEEDSVKLEPIGVFFRSDRAIKGGVYRYPLSPNDTLQLLHRGLDLYFNRHPLFDNRFDESDTTAFYCTELVCFLYQQVIGIDISEGRRHNLPLYPNLIFCSDVFNNSKLEELWKFSGLQAR